MKIVQVSPTTCRSGSDPPENLIRAGSDMLAVSILPQRIRSGVSTGAIGFLLLTWIFVIPWSSQTLSQGIL